MVVNVRQILAYVNRVRDVTCNVDNEAFTLADVEANDVRCPDQEAAAAMYKGAPCAAAVRCMGSRCVVSSAQRVCEECRGRHAAALTCRNALKWQPSMCLAAGDAPPGSVLLGSGCR